MHDILNFVDIRSCCTTVKNQPVTLVEINSLESFISVRVDTRVANITDFSVEVQNLENDPYFSRFYTEFQNFQIFYGFCNFLIFFNIFYRNSESSQASTMEFMNC